MQEKTGLMVALQGDEIATLDIMNGVKNKQVSEYWYNTAEIFSG
jgi:hypothetical protein